MCTVISHALSVKYCPIKPKVKLCGLSFATAPIYRIQLKDFIYIFKYSYYTCGASKRSISLICRSYDLLQRKGLCPQYPQDISRKRTFIMHRVRIYDIVVRNFKIFCAKHIKNVGKLNQLWFWLINWYKIIILIMIR